MKKKEVIDAVVKVFMDKVKQLNLTLQSTTDRARDAPGSNVSHSDTSKFQLSNLALGIKKQILAYQQIIGQLKSLSITPSVKIGIGSLFTLSDIESNEQKIFMMLSEGGGGEKIIVNEVEIITLSVTAPIARACFSKEINDEVRHKNNTFEVIEVQ